MKARVLAAVIVLAAVVPMARGQAGPPDTTAAKAEMKKLDWLVGKWQGTGRMRRGPEEQASQGTETVQRKAGGLALLIEGRFHATGPAGAESGAAAAVHEALGVLAYDAQAKGLRLSTWLADGRQGVYEVKVVDDRTVQWFIPTPRGQIRYTVRHDEQGRWNEVGEVNPDGQTWVKFMDMTLERVKE